MSNYATLKSAISTAIKQNGNEEITGQVLQTTLLSMVDSLVSGYLFKGIATPSTVVGTPDENVFWIAPAGSYSNFGATPIDVPTGCIGIFQYNGSFTNTVVYVGGTVDISALSHTAYASLSQALGDLPAALHIGGIEVRYQDSTTSKFVKYRLMATSWSTTESDWQGVDKAPIIASDNIVDSKSIFNALGGNKGASSSINGYIRRIEMAGEKCVYRPTKWIEDYDNCTLELCFKNAGFTQTQFLLSWSGEDGGNSYWSGFLVGNGSISCILNSNDVNLVFSNVSSLGENIRIAIKKRGTSYTFYVNGEFVGTGTCNNVARDTDIYMGSYVGYLAGYMTDYYYAKLSNDDDGEIVELINAGSEFVELTSERHALGRVFENLPKEPDLTDGNVILTGNITLNTTVTLQANTHIRGNQCLITVGTNGKLIVGEGCSISGIRFNGGWNNPRTKTQLPSPQYSFDPIVTENDLSDLDNYVGAPVIELTGKGASVYDCIFENIERTAILCYDVDAYTLPHQVSVVNNQFDNCKCGIVYSSEFATVSANRIWGCLIGIYAKGGNLSFVNNKILMNDVGIVIIDNGNGGHSEYTGIEIAHCGLHGIYCYRIEKSQGVTFCGSQIFDAGIKLLDTSGFMLIGCRFGTWMEVLWSGHDTYPYGIIGNMVHSNYVTRSYADINNKPLFYYPDGALDLKLNVGSYDVQSSEINN